MEPVLEIAKALGLVREWALARRIRIAERANYDLQTLGFDADDAVALLARVEPVGFGRRNPITTFPGARSS